MKGGFLFLPAVVVAFLVLFSSKIYAQGQVRLEFSTGTCNSAKVDPWNKSTLGIKKAEWSDKNTLKITAFVSLNCASKIIKGDYEIATDIIILKYIWVNPTEEGKEMIAHCLCAQELIYLFKNIERKKYHYKIESIKSIPY